MIRPAFQLVPYTLAGLALVAASAFAPSFIRASAAGPVSGISPPAPLERESPSYPRGAQKRGIEGWVLLEFTVDEKGAVVAPRVVKAVPPGVFDANALKAITNWKYRPATNSGKAVVAPGMRVKLNFQLNDE